MRGVVVSSTFFRKYLYNKSSGLDPSGSFRNTKDVIVYLQTSVDGLMLRHFGAAAEQESCRHAAKELQSLTPDMKASAASRTAIAERRSAK